MSNPMTEKAGLIVTFYGRRSKMPELKKEIGTALGLVKALSDSDIVDLSEPDKGIFLRHFDPAAAHDTTVVQLALNGDENDETSLAWKDLCQQLETAKLKKTLDKFAAQDVFWGYSLIYHATLVQGASLDEETRKQLLQSARRPYPTQGATSEALAETKLWESNLWLLDIPNEGDGAQAATVYVALSPHDREDDLIEKVLYGAGAALLMPDLIAHKGYRQKRQYVGEPRELYRQQIQQAQEIIRQLLDFSPNTTTMIRLHDDANQDLARLSAAYTTLLEATQLLDDLRLSLAQQLENYVWWEDKLGNGDLSRWHYRQIEIAHREVDLLIGKGQSMLEAARTAIEMIQTRLEQIRQENEQRVQILLTAVGIALAVSQLVDPTAAQAILESTIAQLLLQWLNFLPWLTLSADSRLLQLALQFLLTILILITFMITWAYHRWRKKGG